MRLNKIFQRTEDEGYNFWMSYTDLMSGFLVVFIIISAVMYNRFNNQTQKYEHLCDLLRIENPDSLKNYIISLEEIVDSINHSNLKNRIYEYKDIFTSTKDIRVVFDSINGSIILTHQDPNEDLFGSGEWNIKSPLKEYLEDKYVALVRKTMEINNDKNNMELRIEGHTDPTWSDSDRGGNYSFVENLKLSSKRANSVYEYILYGHKLSMEENNFVKMNMISVGYSFSDRVQKGTLDDEYYDPSSRRIEFRILSK